MHDREFEAAVGDRYELIRELGRGGMGVVYLGHDRRRDLEVAIKLRGREQLASPVALKREFRAVAPLRHRNLVELYELVADERAVYFTMEYLDGVDPRRWVAGAEVGPPRGEDGAPLPLDATTVSSPPPTPPPAPAPGQATRPVPALDPARLRHVILELAEGLAFLHERGVIHRDVKPSNTLVTADGTVKLLDFGLALERRRLELDPMTEVVGTAAYLAPEYLDRLEVTPAVDLYALGVVAFELATGAPPFGGSLHRLFGRLGAAALPRASSLNPAVPADLDALIAELLSLDPVRRPSAAAVVARLAGGAPRRERRDLGFIGRRAELARIAATIGGREPRGRLLLLTGPSGSGKTALLERALATEPADETLCWRGRCAERERVPYRAFDLIVDDLATELEGDPRLAGGIEHATALARVFPALVAPLAPSLTAAPAADLRVERERALHAMTELFGRLLRAPRGVITVDDLQWADADSLELLALLVERVGRPLTVLASCTSGDRGEVPPAILDLVARLGPRAEVLGLAAMADDELADLIAAVAPAAPPGRRDEAARQAAGSPYLAELLADELAEPGGDAPEAGATAPEAAELRRLGRLSEAERALAELAALSEAPASYDQLRALADVPGARLLSSLRALEHERVLRASPAPGGEAVYDFYHQRLRAAVYGALPTPRRRALHRRAAEWLERGDGPAPREALAWHWQQADEPARARPWAFAAADAALAQLAFDLAAEWYGRALDLGAEAADALRAREGRAQALLLGGRLAEAAEAYRTLAALDEAAADRWRVRAAEAEIKLGELARGLAELDHVLARRGQRRARSKLGSAARTLAVAARWLLPRPGRAATDEALAAAYRVVGYFLSTPYPVESFEYVLRSVQLARRAGDQAAYGVGLGMIACYLSVGSLGRRGDRTLARGAALVHASGDPYAQMVTAGIHGIVATVQGQWAPMRQAHVDGDRCCRTLGMERSWEASFISSYYALGEFYAGDPAAALAELDALDGRSDDHFSRAMNAAVRGRALVLAGALDEARAVARALAASPAADLGVAAVYRGIFEGELALAGGAWAEAAARMAALRRRARGEWLLTMPAIGAMIDVVQAAADLGLAGADRAAARRAAATGRRLARQGRRSFYAATGLVIGAHAARLAGRTDRAAALAARAAAVAEAQGGAVDRLLAAELQGRAPAAGPLARALWWRSGGAVDVR